MNQRLLKADVAAGTSNGSSNSGTGSAKSCKLSRDKLNDDALRANLLKDSAAAGVKVADEDGLWRVNR